MFTRRMLLCGVAALALFALAVTAGKPQPPPPDPAILYELMRSNSADIQVMNVDGTNQTPIIIDSHAWHVLQWSGDNTRFLFYGAPHDLVPGLFVSSIDGSNVTNIVADAVAPGRIFGIHFGFDWSPAPLPGQPAGDEWIIFEGADYDLLSALYAVRSDGTGLVQLTAAKEGGGPGVNERWPCISPDGTFVVYERFDVTGGFKRIYKATLGTDESTGLPALSDEECLTDLPGTTLAERNCYCARIDPTGTYMLVRTGSPNNYRWLVPLADPAGAWQTPLPPGRGEFHSWLDPETVVYKLEAPQQKSYFVKGNVFTGAETVIAAFSGKAVPGDPVARRWHGSP